MSPSDLRGNGSNDFPPTFPIHAGIEKDGEKPLLPLPLVSALSIRHLEPFSAIRRRISALASHDADGRVPGRCHDCGVGVRPNRVRCPECIAASSVDILDVDGRCRLHHDQPVVDACWTCDQLAEVTP